MAEPHPSLPSTLVTQLRKGRVIPYLGAGISRAAGLPDWEGLLNRMVNWAEENGMPAGRATLIRQETARKKFDQAATALQRDLGDKFIEGLCTILAPAGLQLSLLHERLATVLWPAVITTNFDRLIPQAFTGYKTITWKNQRGIEEVLKTRTAHVMMAHGSLDEPASIVLTPQQYRESLHNPALHLYRTALLSQYSLLFLGVSFDDPDLSYFLDLLCTTLGAPTLPHYALLPDGQVTQLSIEHYRDNYGVETLTYAQTADHAGVMHFLNLLIDQIPPALLTDPIQRLNTLTALQASRTSMTADEYLQQYRNACLQLAADGFLHTARTALTKEYRQSMKAVSAPERIATAIAIADLRTEEHDFELAHQPLLELRESLQDQSVGLALRKRLAVTTIRMLLAEYCPADARWLFDQLSNLDLFDSDIADLNNDLLIAEYLHSGKLPQTTPTRSPHAQAIMAEAEARMGQLTVQLGVLDTQAEEQEKAGARSSAAILRIKRTELLLEDCQEAAAWEEYTRIRALADSLTPAQQWALRRNGEYLQLLLHKGPDSSPSIARSDQQAPTKPEAARLQDLIEAHEASQQKKLYASLPPLWRELVTNVLDCSWGGRRHAHRQLARETMAAGWYKEALQHVLLGENKELAQEFSTRVLSAQNADLTQYVVTTVVERSALARQIEPAAHLLGQIADVIPDYLIPAVLDWFLRTIERPTTDVWIESILIGGWEALQHLIYRLADEQRARILAFTRAHPFIATACRGRQAVVDTLTECIYHLQMAPHLELAEELLPLATTQRHDADFDQVVRLFVLLAQRNKEAQTFLRKALFGDPTGKTDLRLATHAREFGCGIVPEGIARNAERIAAALPLQVWHGTEEPPKFELGNFGSVSATYEEKRLRIAFAGGSSELELLARHQAHIPPGAWKDLFCAVMGLLEHRYNLLANKIMLVTFVERMVQLLDLTQAAAFLTFLRPVAQGMHEPSPAEPAPNSLTSRFKFSGASAQQLQAAGLHAVTTVLQKFPSLMTAEDAAMLQDALLDPNPEPRRLAVDCIAQLEHPTQELQLLLLTATQDTDGWVAATAVNGIRLLWERGHLRDQTDLILTLMKRAIRSSNAVIRRLATEVVTTIEKATKDPIILAGLRDILAAAQADLHFSVRKAATVAKPDDPDRTRTNTVSAAD